MENFLMAQCYLCGNVGTYEMDENETETYMKYQFKGRQMGYLQDLFPKIPNWIRAGAIDPCSSFCICPECSGM